MSRPWTDQPGGLRVSIRLTPRSSRDAVEGTSTLADGRVVLTARVRAVPEGGRANDALIRLLATVLDIPRSHVDLVEGATSRLKTVRIAGEPASLAARLDALLTP